jgi:hypothetical protein
MHLERFANALRLPWRERLRCPWPLILWKDQRDVNTDLVGINGEFPGNSFFGLKHVVKRAWVELVVRQGSSVSPV